MVATREYPTAGPLLDTEDLLFEDLRAIIEKAKPIKVIDPKEKEKLMGKSCRLILELPHILQGMGHFFFNFYKIISGGLQNFFVETFFSKKSSLACNFGCFQESQQNLTPGFWKHIFADKELNSAEFP